MKQLQALILAAGSSRRFPTNKLLQPLPTQTCLLDISYQLASTLTPQVLLVINTDEQLKEHCRSHHYSYLINPEADTGMASSIVWGVNATAEAAGWAIFLADMPCIQPTTLRLLADSWSAHEVMVPTYQRQRGHPVIFSSKWRSALCALSSDQGARGLLQNHPAVHCLETDDAGVCFDIDTQADWETYLEGCNPSSAHHCGYKKN
jgi:molybdenum cofactor cytidylyltransferase